MYEPVFLLRGTPEWDERELDRRSKGNRCISLGAIPPGSAYGEPEHLAPGNQYGPNWEQSPRISR